MVNPFQNEAMKKWLVKYGFELGDNLVVEPNPIGRLFGIGPEVPIVQQYEPHPITRDMGGVSTLFPLTRSVAAGEGAAPGHHRAAARADEPAELGRDEPRGAPARRGAARSRRIRAGPLPVAAVATKDKARIVVVRHLEPRVEPVPQPAGQPRLLPEHGELARRGGGSDLHPAEGRAADAGVPHARSRAQAVFLLPVVVLPALVLAGGIVAVVRRRSAK